MDEVSSPTSLCAGSMPEIDTLFAGEFIAEVLSPSPTSVSISGEIASARLLGSFYPEIDLNA